MAAEQERGLDLTADERLTRMDIALSNQLLRATTSVGTWQTLSDCNTDVVAVLKTDRRYRICNNGPGVVEVKVDGVKVGDNLLPGECNDVEGKKIEVHGFGRAAGTYDNLD